VVVAIALYSRHQSPEFAMEAAKTLGAHNNSAFVVFESLRPKPKNFFCCSSAYMDPMLES